MIQLTTQFSILNFITATGEKLDKLRNYHKSRMDFSRIDSHTLQDLGIFDAGCFIEVARRTCEK